jgi:nucleotide sugar dehydrogenase
MKSIGIIGRGFVGTAILEGMKHAFNVYSYDKAKGYVFQERSHITPFHSRDIKDPIEHMINHVDGPIFVCVPTPMNKDGSCNVSIVESVVKDISRAAYTLGKTGVVVIKSTVIPGTTQRLNDSFNNIHVCFNPEFLTERSAVEDFKKQDRIIVGGPHEGTAMLKQMYETAFPSVPVTKTSSTIAEMIKYLTNCFLATKVSFANEMKQLCDKLEIDYDKVIEYATKDKRLGTSHWSVPGPDGKAGFSGSCFPKDINALMTLACQLGVVANTMEGAWDTNIQVRPERDWEQLKGRAVTDPS